MIDDDDLELLFRFVVAGDTLGGMGDIAFLYGQTSR